MQSPRQLLTLAFKAGMLLGLLAQLQAAAAAAVSLTPPVQSGSQLQQQQLEPRNATPEPVARTCGWSFNCCGSVSSQTMVPCKCKC